MTCTGISGLRRCAIWAIVALLCAPVYPQPQTSQVLPELRLSDKAALHYGVEWRLIRAGIARVNWVPAEASGYQANLHLESAGLVSKLYRVNDDYQAMLNSELCAQNVTLHAEEGRRRRETKITFEGTKADYLERDLLKNSVVLAKETEVAACTHEYLGALNKLRTMSLEIGKSIQIPMSDGKKFAQVRVEAQERERVKTPLGQFNAVRYEIFMFNDVLIRRNARLFLWLTDDSRKLPVQLRVRMAFLIGTITLQLEKVES
jgi:hypothetical protein